MKSDHARHEMVGMGILERHRNGRDVTPIVITRKEVQRRLHESQHDSDSLFHNINYPYSHQCKKVGDDTSIYQLGMIFLSPWQ